MTFSVFSVRDMEIDRKESAERFNTLANAQSRLSNHATSPTH